MTVRLRLILDHDVKEFAFDRPTISVGRSPFNDLVVSHDEVAPRHGALSFDQEEGVVFEVDGCGQPTLWSRDGAPEDSIEPGGHARWVLLPGDVLHLGASKSARVELLSAAVARAPSIEPLLLEGATMPAVARALEVLGSAASWLAASEEPSRVLVQAAGELAIALGLASVRRVDAVVFTPSDEFLDDVHGAIL
ncbi:MAG: FHA domain-containing protein, partial [Myxococcota bacterium]